MEHAGETAYGLWTIVFLNVAIILAFAFSFTKPSTVRDWRSFGAHLAHFLRLSSHYL
tara:strand:- start:7300 stop:7470 length:171 start_codon:yes stop_codon:yes gene_type:complete